MYLPESTPKVTVLPVRVPIPAAFYSSETDAPFRTCLVCDRPLLEDSTEYLIEKGMRHFEAYDVVETVFGYAMCVDCHATMNQSFSTLSKKRCQAYLAEHLDLSSRTGTLLEEDTIDPSRWTRHCIVHDTPREDLREYQMLAHCQGEKMLLTHFPLMIGGPAVDELAQCLSNETLDELDGFRNEHFGLPPELEQDLQGPILV